MFDLRLSALRTEPESDRLMWNYYLRTIRLTAYPALLSSFYRNNL